MPQPGKESRETKHESKRNALPPEPTPKLGPHHKRMEAFVGKWHSDGWAAEESAAGRVPMTHLHTYEWLPGGFFLVHRWDGRIGDKDNEGIEIIGPDAAYFFDNGGWSRVYQIEGHDRVWMFTGKRERAKVVISEDGHTMTCTWEQTKDGSGWQPLCEVKATKAR